jgi:hypothetical protein
MEGKEERKEGKKKIHRNKVEWCLLEARVRGKEKFFLMGIEFHICKMKKFWRLIL